MSFLDRLGLSLNSGRYSRRAGLRTDNRRPKEQPVMSQRDVLVRAGLFVALGVLALNAFPRIAVFQQTARVGDIWNESDVIAPFDFSIRLPEEEVQARRDSVLRYEEPIFTERPEALAQTLARLDSVDARLDSTFAAYVDYRRARERLAEARSATEAGGAPPTNVQDLRAAVRRDSARFVSRRAGLSLALDDGQWNLLLASAWESYQRGGQPLDDRLLSEASRIARELVGRGVLDVPRDSVQTPAFLVQNLTDRTESERQRIEVVGSDEARVLARRSLFAAFPGRQDTVAIGAALYTSAFEPSLVYNEQATERKREETLQSVLPTRGRVRQGQIVIRTGDEVTQERYERLTSLSYAQRARQGDTSWALTLLGRSILVGSALALFFLYTYLLRPTIYQDTRQFTLACLILGVILLGFFVAGLLEISAAAYGVPVALASILLTILYDSRVGSFATLTLASLGGLVFGYDFPYVFATLIVGVLAVFSVRDVKNRSQLLASSGLVALGFAIVLVGFAVSRADPWTGRLFDELIAIGVHSAFILFAGPLLWGMERVFGVTTDITLLELSDTNRPILKKLSTQAPGTFNHSLQVANLAEAAADAIGANALRARVGALYHDIGKMLKPEYFIENQPQGENPHEQIKPSMSALVIAAHVKEGVQLAREQNLPRVVRDFIASHHGTGLIEFFYRKAQEAADDPSDVEEAGYRYPGPRPQTNEQAIVMLADSVEAASRSLDKPTPRRLESLIDGIVAARIADGQLDEAALTFADLARIKEAFHALLCGIYHFRVKYPDQASEDDDSGTPTRKDEPADDRSDGASADLESEPPEETGPTEGTATPEERSTLG